MELEPALIAYRPPSNMPPEIALSGTSLPPRFRSIVDRFGDNPTAMMDAGVAYATEQIIDLFANGVNNVHVYTMNRPEIAIRIMLNLHGIIA